MNRYSRAAAAALIMVSGFGAIGCVHSTGRVGGDRYRNLVDTSWPDRYNHDARQAVLAPFAQQVANGHFEEQTLWNWYFEPGSDRLHPAGMAKLDTLARKHQDTKIYLQNAGDLPLTPDNGEQILVLRDGLNAKRAAAVHRYLASKPAAPAYEIAVHDGPTPGIPANFATNAYRSQLQGYVGSIGAAAAATAGVAPAAPNINSGATLGSGSSGSVGPAAGSGGGAPPTTGGAPGTAP